jgi:hypothetical protein
VSNQILGSFDMIEVKEGLVDILAFDGVAMDYMIRCCD